MQRNLKELKRKLLLLKKDIIDGGIITEKELEMLTEGLTDKAIKDMYNCYNPDTGEFIYNNLKQLAGVDAKAVLESCKIHPSTRAQELSEQQFCQIAKLIFQK